MSSKVAMPPTNSAIFAKPTLSARQVLASERLSRTGRATRPASPTSTVSTVSSPFLRSPSSSTSSSSFVEERRSFPTKASVPKSNASSTALPAEITRSVKNFRPVTEKIGLPAFKTGVAKAPPKEVIYSLPAAKASKSSAAKVGVPVRSGAVLKSPPFKTGLFNAAKTSEAANASPLKSGPLACRAGQPPDVKSPTTAVKASPTKSRSGVSLKGAAASAVKTNPQVPTLKKGTPSPGVTPEKERTSPQAGLQILKKGTPSLGGVPQKERTSPKAGLPVLMKDNPSVGAVPQKERTSPQNGLRILKKGTPSLGGVPQKGRTSPQAGLPVVKKGGNPLVGAVPQKERISPQAGVPVVKKGTPSVGVLPELVASSASPSRKAVDSAAVGTCPSVVTPCSPAVETCPLAVSPCPSGVKVVSIKAEVPPCDGVAAGAMQPMAAAAAAAAAACVDPTDHSHISSSLALSPAVHSSAVTNCGATASSATITDLGTVALDGSTTLSNGACTAVITKDDFHSKKSPLHWSPWKAIVHSLKDFFFPFLKGGANE